MRLNISAITCINKAGEGDANKMIEKIKGRGPDNWSVSLMQTE